MKLRSLSFVIACAAPLAAGCLWRVSARAPALQIDSAPVVVEAAPVAEETMPAEIEMAPQVAYDGRLVYLYHDRWYFRDGPRWRYYRHEPRLLLDHHLRFGYGRREDWREHREDRRGHDEHRH